MPDDRDVRLVVVLLEEHPLEHPRAVEPVVGHELGALGEVPEDRSDSGRCRPSSSSSTGTRRAGILAAEHRPAAILRPRVHLDPLERHASWLRRSLTL